MSTLSQIKGDLKAALSAVGAGVTVAFDYAAPPEASAAIIIDGILITYEHQLDLGRHRRLTADLNVYAKTAEGLDSLIDAIDALDAVDTGTVRYITIDTIQINADDPDVKSAKVSVDAFISD